MSINKKQAFTLIELLVVITIIGLISTVAIFALNSASMKARDAKRMSDLKVMSLAVENYHINTGQYPEIGINVSACGQEGIIAYIGSGAGKQVIQVCYDNHLIYGDDTYIDRIPTPPSNALNNLNMSMYRYGITSYVLPCLYITLETTGDLFWCQAGNCKMNESDFCSFGE